MVLDFFTNPGYLGIVVFLVLTGCGMPIPEEVPIILAGVYSADGKLVLEWAYAACIFGAILGDSVMYAIGYHFGHNLLCDHPRLSKFLHADRERRYEEALVRHGFQVMLVSRFMIGVRGAVYLSAGVVRMPFRVFLLYDLICATLVVSTFFGIAYAYGKEIAQWIREAEYAFTLIVLLVVGCVVLWFYRQQRQKAMMKKHDCPDQDAAVSQEAELPGDDERQAS